jgi:DNA-binding NarL/FixJ family response regulator
VPGGASVDHVILIVDSDPSFRRFARRALSEVGFPVRAVASGQEALDCADHETVALVVLEVRLDDMSGYEVCRRLRGEHGEGLPIMFVSQDRTEPSDRVAGLLLGADDYLAKPLDREELVARARRHLQRLATWNGAGVRLTARERQILQLLAAGLGPAEISGELSISTKTVATHVEHIYAKLGVHTRAQAVASAFRLALVER